MRGSRGVVDVPVGCDVEVLTGCDDEELSCFDDEELSCFNDEELSCFDDGMVGGRDVDWPIVPDVETPVGFVVELLIVMFSKSDVFKNK